MEFHTLGLGSLASIKKGAEEMIRSSSLTKEEHAEQFRRCACCSALLRLSTSDKFSCNSPHVIPLSPSHFPYQRKFRCGLSSCASATLTSVVSGNPSPSTRWSYFPTEDFPAFSALFILSRSRNFILALCNWDLLFPIEHP